MSLATTLGRTRFHGSDQPTEEIRLTRRNLRQTPPGWAGWSLRTQLILAGLGLLTAIVGIVLVVQVVGAQDLRAEGRESATAASEALETARGDVAALAEAVDAATPAAADAKALSDLIALRATDLSTAAVDAVADAADALSAVVEPPVAEPSLPSDLNPASLPDRYVSADDAERDRLRQQVAAQIDRLTGLGDAADARITALTEAQGGVTTAVGETLRAAETAAPGILAAGPEAAADARTRLEQAVAALAALGEAPDAGAATRDALTEYFSAADGFRLSHEQAVAARVAAEQAAAEEAARQAEEQNPWWWGWWDQGPDRGRG